jgi:predicted RNA binding protein YcfA (HicA-like mRNA interferase family)
MPKLRRLSGSDVVRIFGYFGFLPTSQRGSHIKLRRINAAGEKQTLTIPNHAELDTGTCRSIFRQAIRYIPEDDLRPYFFTS